MSHSQYPLDASSIHRLAILGNYVPRLCGIATFTRDLQTSLVHQMPELDCLVVAMNDGGKRYDYPPEVRWQIEAEDPDAYRAAAEFLNDSHIDALCVQHEFGIFGGPAGRYVTRLLEAVRVPILTTLHTILATPNAAQDAAMDDIIHHSSRLVTMSEIGAGLLRRVYGVPPSLIDVIPHGIPDVPVDPMAKARIGLAGRRLILTFGLLSPDKGIEHVIGALPAIAARFPNVTYLVVGATHPHVYARDGERYREGLVALAARSGVSAHVKFIDRFISQEELVQVLSAADIYVTPYSNPEQITSGTLAYALGAGKAVISTPYRYARELLAEGHGILVPWRSSEGIADAAIDLFQDPARCASVCGRAAQRGRSMLWPKVARSYWKALSQTVNPAAEPSVTSPRSATQARTLPALSLNHLRVLTDGVGLLQHAILSVPRYEEGYTLDDNARALRLMTTLGALHCVEEDQRRRLEANYFGFVRRAFDGPSGRFRNFMSYKREWLELAGSEDSHGRAIWSLGTVIGQAVTPQLRVVGDYLLRASLLHVPRFTSPRAWAFVMLGLDDALERDPKDARFLSALQVLSRRLLDLFDRNAEPAWPWCEDSVTYANARLPQALIAAGMRQQDDHMVSTGLRALRWLTEIQRSSTGDFSPIGSNGFYPRLGEMAAYDQQPIEGAGTVDACLQAFGATKDEHWLATAKWAFSWFLGKNTLGRPLFDEETGGCRDGLHPDRLNENQGAESTLAFLQALGDLIAAERALPVAYHSEAHVHAAPVTLRATADAE